MPAEALGLLLKEFRLPTMAQIYAQVGEQAIPHATMITP